MHAVEAVYDPSGGHLGKRKENEEFETWFFEVAILHHGWGIYKRLDLAVAKIIGWHFKWCRVSAVIIMSLAPIGLGW